MCGDWNLCQDAEKDCENYLHVNNPSRQVARICILAQGGLNVNERHYCCEQSVVHAGQPLGRCNFV